ncbi:hypothetical protein ACS0TY_005079 [Phlomoides rotata]
MARSSNFMSTLRDQKGWRTCFCSSIIPATTVFIFLLFLGSTEKIQIHKVIVGNLGNNNSKCESECSRPPGSETLPQGIVTKTSNLERRPLWGSPEKTNTSTSLFAAAVGIKQKNNVEKMVQKFLESDFVVMLFHYDGIVDQWKDDFNWSSSVIHVSADNQTKWWFAKRFLHPDIVAEYEYIFLWDEDLGVENFNPHRYLSIVKVEGLEISQPALDIEKSEVHHLITARSRRSKIHRRAYKHDGKGIQCDENSTGPPCTGFIEVMAPVFSKAAWRCVWYMMQNDLIHAWGLDLQLGYCAQGARTQNIGVVDVEYIVHYGLPTLGEPDQVKLEETPKEKKVTNISVYFDIILLYIYNLSQTSPLYLQEPSQSNGVNKRIEVRRQSYNEFKVFRRRWKKAAEMDKCWNDLYPDELLKQGSSWPQF